MKGTEPITNPMEQKRRALLDNCTRALCGDTTLDSKLLDAATGGRYNDNGEDKDLEQIKTLVLALRWLELPEETVVKTRKRRTSRKASAGNGKPIVKRRGRPKGSKNKPATPRDQEQMSIQNLAPPPVETPVETPQVETPIETQPPIPMTPPGDLKDVTFEGGGLPQ